MHADFNASFPANTAGLHAALDAVERLCNARCVDQALISRARIIVEELFTNTIKHGYGGESDRPVRLKLKLDPVFRLTFEDDANHFDPTQWNPVHHRGLSPDHSPEGQAGIALVLGLSSEVRHIKGATGNRVAVTIEL